MVSEICLLNIKKKNNLEIYFITSPSHITYCVVLQFKPELPYHHMFILTKLELRKLFQIYLCAQPMGNHSHPYIHSTSVLCGVVGHVIICHTPL